MTAQRSTTGERLLIVLGAGASFGAREEPRPPLGAELLGYVASYLDKHDADPLRSSPLSRDEGKHARRLVQSAIERGETFEAMINRIRREAEYPAYDESLRELTLAIVGALQYERVGLRVDEAFAPKPDRYDELVSLIIDAGWSKENASFLSLNYDLLLEEALKRATPEPRADYPDDLTVAFDWRLYKPHGSANWCAASPIFGLGHGGPIAELSAAGITLPFISRTTLPSQMAGHRGYAPVVAH